MTIVHLPNDSSAEEVAATVGRDGAAIVDDLAAPELLDRIHEELQPYLRATPEGPDSFSGRLTKRTGALVARSPSCRELVIHQLAVERRRRCSPRPRTSSCT